MALFGQLIDALDSREIIKVKKLDVKDPIFIGPVEGLFMDKYDAILTNYKNTEVYRITVSYGRIMIILD